MNKTNPREKLEAVIFMSTIASRKSEGLTASHSRGSDEYTGDSIIGGVMCDARLSEAAAGGWIHSSLAQGEGTSKPKSTIWKYLAWIAIATILAITCLGGCGSLVWASGITTEASYYTRASVLAEGNSGICANGEVLKDEGEYTFAHATLPFGARARITNIKFPDRQIVARCNDRGPAARLRRLGRQIDVNLSAARALGIVQSGVAMVMVEWVSI